MKILITGANGMLAKSVRTKLSDQELICTDVKNLDITDLKAVLEFVEQTKPEYIINCAAFTAVDKAETAGKIVEQINAEGPKNLAIAADKLGAILIHISTDYVFGGNLELSKSYKENDIKSPVTEYGRTKLLGEQAIQENTKKYYIFRTAWLYGDGNNFVKTMLKLGKLKDEINVVSDQHGSPTYAEDLAQIIKETIEKKIPYGVYHTTNEGYTTWYDFTKAIFEKANITCKVNPVTTEEYIKMMNVEQAKRPENSQLSKEKLNSVGIEIPTWQNALDRYLEIELNVQ
mgnify:CR=1 FL=1